MKFQKSEIFSFLKKKLITFALLASSCQQTTEIDFPFAQMEYPQPHQFTVLPKTDSIRNAPGTSTIPIPTITPYKSEKELTSTNAHPNWHQIPKDLTEFIVKDDMHIQLPFNPSGNGRDANYSINNNGDTLLTGRLIKIKGRVMNVEPGEPIVAASPRFKDFATSNIQYLDVDQGMVSSYVFSLLEDQQGSLWFGNGLGVSNFDGVNFTHYTQKEGFSMVWSMLEDQKGRIWFGTIGEGIIKYDGHKFTNYQQNAGLTEIYAIEEDLDGQLWFGTRDGLVKYDGQDFFSYGADEGFLDVFVNAIFEDSDGQLWIGTEEGVIMFDGRKFIKYTINGGLSDNSVVSIFEDSKGHLWFGTKRAGVYKFNGESIVPFTTKEGLSGNSVRVILEDNAGNIWLNTDGGGANQFYGNHLIHYGEKEGLYVDIYASIIDSGGNIWFGTNGGGVSKFSPNSFNHFSEADGLVNSYIYAIEEDRNGRLWFGTDDGISVYDGQNFTNFLTNDIEFQAIYEDKEGKMWFGTIDYGLWMYDGSSIFQYDEDDGLGDNTIMTIAEDQFGNLWFGTDGGGATKYDGKRFSQFTKDDGLTNDVVNVIWEDRNGTLWFGTEGGLSKYDGFRFINYTVDRGLQLGGVQSIAEDQKGNLWLGSGGNGICMYDGNSFMRFTEIEGLSYDVTWALLVDHNGHIWVTTEKGLNQIIPIADKKHTSDRIEESAKYKIMTYEIGDGLKGLDFLPRSILLDRKKQLWLGGGKCLSMIDLNKHESPSGVPNVFMRRLDIGGELIDYQKSSLDRDNGIENNGVQPFGNLPLDLRLSYSKNHVTFHYSAIDWSAPHDLHYSFILDGLNDHWSPPTNDTKADYRNVPPGKYTFRVRSRGKSMLWSEAANFSFVVNPPWYQTWWARGIFIVLGISLVVLIFLIRERNARIIRKKLELMVDEKTSELQIEKAEVTKQLEQKEVLMQEVHHRVKNNLTFLKSLLYLRASASDDSDVKMILDECQARIQSMALVHQNLYDIDDATDVDFRVFLKELFTELENMYDQSHSDVLIDIDTSDIKIDMKLSVFLGLILNEMITNSYKYAFDGSSVKRIGVLLSDEGTKFRMNYSDNGVGFPENFNMEATSGFGFKLINILLDQINAEMTHSQNGLNTFTITIPK